MKFKNVRVFNLPKDFSLPAYDELEEHLYEYAYTEISTEQAATAGFISPFGRKSSVLSHQVGENVLLATRKEEKIVPEAAVTAALEKKELEYFEQYSEAMPKKMKSSFREEIKDSMVRTAFTRFKDTFAYFDKSKKRLIVGVTASSAAEDFTSLLRLALGTFPSIPWGQSVNASFHLSAWLRAQEIPEGFEFGEQIELSGVGDDKSAVTAKKQDLLKSEILSLLDSNKECTKLELSLPNHLDFSLDTDLAIKGISLSDIVITNSIDDTADDYAARIDSDFVLWSSEINAVLDKLDSAFVSTEAESAAA